MGEGEAAGLSTLPGGGWRVLQQAFGGGDDSRRRLVWCKLQLVRRRAAEDLPVHPDQIPWRGVKAVLRCGAETRGRALGAADMPLCNRGPWRGACSSLACPFHSARDPRADPCQAGIPCQAHQVGQLFASCSPLGEGHQPIKEEQEWRVSSLQGAGPTYLPSTHHVGHIGLTFPTGPHLLL